MADVQLIGIEKSYAGAPILKSIALDAGDGEFVVVVGPSGSGKSTLLRLVAGLDEPDAGEVRIGGVRVNGLGPAERGVAMVFQSYALYPHMNVYDNMGFALKIAGATKDDIDAAVRSAAKSLAIEDLLWRKPRALSGGQRQRVAIGRAIVRKPRVFLFDEPLSNLDSGLRVRMRYEFVKLRKSLGATTLYVTHDQVEAMTLADKIVVLEDGAVRQAGPPLELYRRPANMFVASFIGSPKMNFFAAEALPPQGALARLRLAWGEILAASIAPAALAQGAKVTVGVRPEHLALASEGALRAVVTFVEELGNAAFAHARTSAGDDIVVQMSAEQSLRTGETISLSAAPEHVHVFGAGGDALARTTT